MNQTKKIMVAEVDDDRPSMKARIPLQWLSRGDSFPLIRVNPFIFATEASVMLPPQLYSKYSSEGVSLRLVPRKLSSKVPFRNRVKKLKKATHNPSSVTTLDYFEDEWQCSEELRPPRDDTIPKASRSIVAATTFQKRWTIEGFGCLVESTRPMFSQLSSPTFTSTQCNCLRMNLKVLPRRRVDQTEILLVCTSALSSSALIRFTVEVEGVKNRLTQSSEMTLKASNRWQTSNCTVFHIPHSELLTKDLLVDGQKLVLHCKGEIIHHRPSIIVPELNEFLLNRIADVKLVFPEQGDLYAHKLVLAYRSPVFEAMFLLDTVESEENVVQIVDINRKVFSEVLVYLYTEQIANLYDYAEEIFIVADRYAILDLKTIAEEWLCNMMTVEEAEYWQQFAEHYCAQQLAAKASQLLENESKKMNRQTFQQMTPVETKTIQSNKTNQMVKEKKKKKKVAVFNGFNLKMASKVALIVNRLKVFMS